MIYVTIEDYFNIYVKLLQIKLNILTINKKINKIHEQELILQKRKN